MNTLQILGLIAIPVLLWLYWRERRKHRRTTERMGQALQDLSGRLAVDPHTGLLTPAGFDAKLDEEVARVGRTDGSLSILVLALDNFGLITNGFDAAGAAQVVKAVADRLVECAGKDGKVATLSNSEFMLLVSGGPRIGTLLAERIKTAFARPVTLGDGQRSVHVSCSTGIAVFPEHGDAAKMLAHATLALQQAQRAEPGSFRLYEPAMASQARDEAVLVQDLRQAVALGQLELYFQPKIDARSLKVTAAESLVRWHHPTRGFVSPGIFIPLAERYGMIGAVGDWVIEAACQAAEQWNDIGLRMRVAVNISGHQLRQDDMVDHLRACLKRHGIPPSRFTLEITETVAMEDTRVTHEAFERLREAGVHVSIDDFGTGHSSLSTLRNLPAAELKIDRAFVTDLETSAEARSIAVAIVKMAHTLDLRVVAEGVETEAQRDWLVQMGCDELQGYLFAKPMSPTALGIWASGETGPSTVGFRDSLFKETAPQAIGPQ